MSLYRSTSQFSSIRFHKPHTLPNGFYIHVPLLTSIQLDVNTFTSFYITQLTLYITALTHHTLLYISVHVHTYPHHTLLRIPPHPPNTPPHTPTHSHTPLYPLHTLYTSTFFLITPTSTSTLRSPLIRLPYLLVISPTIQ